MLIFSVTTIIYLVTRWLIFKGFNGTDDLHYSMLAAKMIQGTYDPFQPDDIYSGRILLIATQAAVYKLAGINVITTQAGSMIVVILSCFLTVFRLLPVKNATNTLLASALFYFNPVITYHTIGINGDAYLMLAAIAICIMLRSWSLNAKQKRQSLLTGMLTAMIVVVALLYKETILVFIPFICFIAYWYARRSAWLLITGHLITFLLLICLYACLYYFYTGDAFFKINQINNSHYLNRCSYDMLPFKYLATRLTYGVWQEFVTQGFYPVIFGSFLSAVIVYRQRLTPGKTDLFAFFFAALLLSCLYFPFSFSGYQPLCSDARQFIMLLPLGVIVTTGFVNNPESGRNNNKVLLFISLAILVMCLLSTGNKWQWMIYSLLFLFFIFIDFVKIPTALKYSAFTAILWLSILEHLFYKNSNWFSDTVNIDKQINARYYYFPEHDNMMHWQLLHQFNNNTFYFYNLEKKPFKLFKIYYQRPDSAYFHPGWLIINKAYTARSPLFLQKIDSLQKTSYFKKQLIVGDVSAFMIDTPERFVYIRSVIQEDEK